MRKIILSFFILLAISTFSIHATDLKSSLQKEAPALNPFILDKALAALHCADKTEVSHTPILAIIDYSLGSNEKRLWIFDLQKRTLLFNTYLAHGIKSGVQLSQYFSDRNNSKTSSIGLFVTDKIYRGRHGYSLKLQGLDKHFNDSAYNRFIVMHGAWYTSPEFIKKYGRAGRSWGCPAVPDDLAKPIIDVLKEGALIFAYYPNNQWLQESKYFQCAGETTTKLPVENEPKPIDEERDAILFGDLNKNDKQDLNEPIVAITADNYQRFFHKDAPLNRMLRRQINQTEYIALTPNELHNFATPNQLEQVYLIMPEVKLVRGYYATEMKILDMGKMSKISGDYVMYFVSKPPVQLKSSQHFIRWIGL